MADTTNTTYQEIYDRFLNKIEDVDLPQLSEEDQTLELNMWLDSAIGHCELEGLTITHDLTDRDFEKQCFNSKLSYGEIELLALEMVVVWLEQKVNSLEHTLMFFGTKEEKFTNQKDHLNAIRSLRSAYQKEVRLLVVKYGFRNNSYLNDEGTTAS